MQPAYPQSSAPSAEPSLPERQRRELLQLLEPAGRRPVAELAEMSDAERCKWLFWNLHENLDEIRLMEPTLQARVTSMQYTVLDSSPLSGNAALEKRLDLAC